MLVLDLNSAPTLTKAGDLGSLPNLSEPRFPQLKMEALMPSSQHGCEAPKRKRWRK